MVSSMEWVGGARSPGLGGWNANASWPFAVLGLDDRRVTLRLRWFARLLGKNPLDCPDDALELALARAHEAELGECPLPWLHGRTGAPACRRRGT